MMHLYNIGYCSCEESEYEQLFHSKKFSYDELEAVVHDAIMKVLETNPKFTEYQSLHDDVIKILVSEHNFKKVEFTECWYCWGWSDVTIKDSWNGYRSQSDTLTRLYDKIQAKKKEKDDD